MAGEKKLRMIKARSNCCSLNTIKLRESSLPRRVVFGCCSSSQVISFPSKAILLTTTKDLKLSQF